MRRKIALSAATVCCIAGIAFAQTAPNAQQTGSMGAAVADDRQPVPVTSATRTFVLAETRKMLAAAQGIAEAVGKRDSRAIAASARTSGLKAFQGMPKQIMMELPDDFRGMGRQAHMSFDGIAEAADSGADAAAVSTKLGETLQFCVACHEAYRFTSRN
jgi:cytochrome c556